MPITIQCPGCGTQYPVADDLAGTVVNCRDCKTIIFVPEPPPIPLEEPEPEIETLEESLCPACGKVSTIIDETCMTCGFNLRSGKSLKLPTMDVAGQFPKGPKRSRYRRRRDWRPLRKIDNFIFGGMFWILLASAFTWIVRVSWNAGTFSFHVILPTVLLLTLVFAVIAPAMATAVLWGCNWLRRDARRDNYKRACTALALPVAMTLCFSGINDPLCAGLIVCGWGLGLVLLVYLFRAKFVEWVVTFLATVLAAGGAALAAAGIMWLLSAISPETLPVGPWGLLASKQKPPVAVAATQVVTPPVATQVAVETTLPEGDPVDVEPPAMKLPAVKGAAAKLAAVIKQATGQTPPAVVTAPPRNGIKPATPVVGTSTSAKPLEVVRTRVEGVGEVVAYPGLQNVQTVIVGDLVSPYFLVIRNVADGIVMAERWDAGTIEKKGELRFDELPREPRDYALSPSGTLLLSLARFPNNELQLRSFENSGSMRKVQLDQDGLLGTPRLVGFIDSGHFIIRWSGKRDMLQLWSSEGVLMSQTHSLAMGDDVNQWAINSNPGRTGAKLAALLAGENGESQIFVGMMEGWTLVQRFTPRNRSFQAAGMAFSSDANTVGICALTADGGTVMTFDLRTDKNSQTIVFPSSVYSLPMAHGLVWMENSDLLLVGGNTLYDSVSGERIGVLGLANILDAHCVGSNTLLLLQDAKNGMKSGLVVKVNASLVDTARADEKK